MAAAVLADLPPGKGLEEEIEAELGTGACKVWKEMKLLLQPQGKCENKEHIAGKEDGEEEFVCEEADCLLLWLEDKTFSVSARTALMAWALLLARSKQSSLIFPPSALQEQVISTLNHPHLRLNILLGQTRPRHEALIYVNLKLAPRSISLKITTISSAMIFLLNRWLCMIHVKGKIVKKLH